MFVKRFVEGLKVFRPQEESFGVGAKEKMLSCFRVAAASGRAGGVGTQVPSVLTFLEW